MANTELFLFSSINLYQPIEEKFKLTRRSFEIILAYKFLVEIATKSMLVLKDLDSLKEINKTPYCPTS